jgi:hypothetical protein
MSDDPDLPDMPSPEPYRWRSSRDRDADTLGVVAALIGRAGQVHRSPVLRSGCPSMWTSLCAARSCNIRRFVASGWERASCGAVAEWSRSQPWISFAVAHAGPDGGFQACLTIRCD